MLGLGTSKSGSPRPDQLTYRREPGGNLFRTLSLHLGLKMVFKSGLG